MAKAKDIHDPGSVTEHILKLDPAVAKIVELIRRIILSTDPVIGEQIKWNSPAFFYNGPMKPFDPKEYKRDIAVVHARGNKILLVLPTGATIPDTTGILEGNYTDGRRMITFKNQDDVGTKENDLREVIRQWLQLVEQL